MCAPSQFVAEWHGGWLGGPVCHYVVLCPVYLCMIQLVSRWSTVWLDSSLFCYLFHCMSRWSSLYLHCLLLIFCFRLAFYTVHVICWLPVQPVNCLSSCSQCPVYDSWHGILGYKIWRPLFWLFKRHLMQLHPNFTKIFGIRKFDKIFRFPELLFGIFAWSCILSDFIKRWLLTDGWTDKGNSLYYAA